MKFVHVDVCGMILLPGSFITGLWLYRKQYSDLLLQVTYDYTLAKLYMWAQTDNFLHIAVHCPTGMPRGFFWNYLSCMSDHTLQ